MGALDKQNSMAKMHEKSISAIKSFEKSYIIKIHEHFDKN